MVRHNSKVLQHLLQDFKGVFDHSGTLSIKGLNPIIPSAHFKNFVANTKMSPVCIFSKNGYSR